FFCSLCLRRHSKLEKTVPAVLDVSILLFTDYTFIKKAASIIINAAFLFLTLSRSNSVTDSQNTLKNATVLLVSILLLLTIRWNLIGVLRP
ncbi:MAG: hypothetical protein ACTHWC_10200, partial [Psychrobacter sp.]